MFIHLTQQVAYLDITIAHLVQLAEDSHIVLQGVLLEGRELRLPTRAAPTHTLEAFQGLASHTFTKPPHKALWTYFQVAKHAQVMYPLRWPSPLC